MVLKIQETGLVTLIHVMIPYDYDPSCAPTSDSAYPLKELYDDLTRMKPRSVTVVLDACFSGQADSVQGTKVGSVLKAASRHSSR